MKESDIWDTIQGSKQRPIIGQYPAKIRPYSALKDFLASSSDYYSAYHILCMDVPNGAYLSCFSFSNLLLDLIAASEIIVADGSILTRSGSSSSTIILTVLGSNVSRLAPLSAHLQMEPHPQGFTSGKR